MRIAMMGSGGIGGYFGGRMAEAGADVTFVARGHHLAAMQNGGLRIESRDMGDAVINPAQATDDPARVGPVDYVIIGVKLWDTENIGRSLLPMLGPDTAILSLQNGVDCDDILAPIVGRERLISGVAFIASSIGEPGLIRHIGTMQRIVMGEADGTTSPRIGALRDMMTKAGIAAEISDDIERTLWEKFVFLVGLSSTTTLMRTTLGPIRENPESRAFLHSVFRETVAVGRAHGVDLPEDFADTRLPFADGLPAEMTSSMHHDFEAGNKLELPWLAGTVVRLGRESGIETPVCQTVYAALLQHVGGRKTS
jgi:2-dehydropantoate 2-reductase